MSKRKSSRHQKRSGEDQVRSAKGIADGMHRFCMAMLVALLVATTLVPTDAPAELGISVVIVFLWIVLLAIWLLGAMLQQPFLIRWDWTAICLFSLVAMHVVSLLVMAYSENGNVRAGLNMTWRWISFGVAFFLVRQLLTTPQHCRCVCSVMLALAVSVSAYGLYQHFYVIPAHKDEFNSLQTEAERKEWFERNVGIYHPPGTPERQHLLDRVIALEPTATFSLTNTLGAFLVPWMVLLVAIGISSWPDASPRARTIVVISFSSIVVALCLLVTKSRTSWIAAAAGIVAIGIYSRMSGVRLNWKLPAIGFSALLVVTIVAVIAGGIDLPVVTQTLKSFSYRLEYWESAWSMIVDHPLFGCGPGNFKTNYTQYKLASASETVADPHNFLLEVWATAGSLALCALLATFACFGNELRHSRESSTSPPKTIVGLQQTVYGGACIGLLLGLMCGFAVGHPFKSDFFVVGLPLGVGCVSLLRWWVKHGTLPVGAIAIAVFALLLNLLATGGIGFLGVAIVLWTLLAMALNQVPQRPAWRLPRTVGIATAIAGFVVMIVCQKTLFAPVLDSHGALFDAQRHLRSRDFLQAEEALNDAANADPYSPDPWETLTFVYLDRWRRSSDYQAGRKEFQKQASELVRRNPKSDAIHRLIARCYLDAYQFSKDLQDLDAAVDSFEETVRLYPSSSFHHAQLAWVYQLAGDDKNASRVAEKALQLDQQHAHWERKLSNRKIYTATARDTRSAEQIMNEIRNSTASPAPSKHDQNQP